MPADRDPETGVLAPEKARISSPLAHAAKRDRPQCDQLTVRQSFQLMHAWRSPTVTRDAEADERLARWPGAAHTAPAILCVDWKKSGQVITPGQIRAARSLVGWNQADLAAASGLSETEIRNI